MKILVANIGSTSFKYQLLAMPEGFVLAQGREERIGQSADCPDYRTAIGKCLGEIAGPGGPLEDLRDLAAVGFKAVLAQGIDGARRVDDPLLEAMEAATFLAPAHNPPYLDAMRAFRQVAPSVPLVAVFETAFFDTLDDAVTTYAVPFEWREQEGIRRLGFHGASHRFAAERARQLLGKERFRHVSCHLGGSSSLAAIQDGRAVNTSFGMSPQSGLPQTRRAGDVDIFAILHLMKRKGYGPDEMACLLGQDSGLAGLSGLSGDIRDLRQAAGSGNQRARLALEVYVHAVRHYLGAFLVQLGGIDVLSFSGGTGERDPQMRADICAGLESFGIGLEPGLNAMADGECRLSPAGSAVEVWILPANEEWIVARETARIAKEWKGEAAVLRSNEKA